MAKEIDAYREWLGIAETARPLNHYQLLRLKSFEDNSAKIREHYRKMNAHVRKFATGDYSRQSQALLNELARAMLTLTDVARKREYDASLGRSDSGELRRRTFEEVLLANKVVDQAQLDKARNYAKAVGLEVRDAVLQQKLATPDVVMLAYAESIGLPYLELGDVGVDEQLASQIAPTMARQYSCVPVMADGGQLLMASPNPLVPDVEEELRLRFSMPVRTVLCTPASINDAIAKYYPPDAVQAAPAPSRGKQNQAAPAAATPAAAKPALSPEERAKRQKTAAILGFNLTVIVTMLLFTLVLQGSTFLGIILSVLLGSAVAGAAWFVAGK